jgi:hypothetical protein
MASKQNIPTAPYPPMRGGGSPQKSSFTSSPHYTAYGGGGTGSYRDGSNMGVPAGDMSTTSATPTADDMNSQFSSLRIGSSSARQYHKAGSNVSSSAHNTVSSVSSAANSNNPTQLQQQQHPSQIIFCPGWHDTVASINCVSRYPRTASFLRPPPRILSSGSNLMGDAGLAAGAGTSSAFLNDKQPTSSRKVGPIMMELRKLELADGACTTMRRRSSFHRHETFHRTNSSTVTSFRGEGRLLNLPASLRNVSDHDKDDTSVADQDMDEIVMDNEGDADMQPFFTTRVVGVSRGNPSLGLSVASTCLSMSPVQTYDSIMAATGSTTGTLCIHRFDTEEMDEIDMTNASVNGNLATSRLSFAAAPIEYFHNSRHHRTASAVAWRTEQTNHVAIGLAGGSGTGSMPHAGHHHHHRRSGASMRAGSDREFCCFLWDVNDNKKTTAPIQKLCHNSPVASMAWVMEGHTLVVGGQHRTIQLYDMRVAADRNFPPISTHAHESGVHGIEIDPHRPHIMATFCRAVGEPVKLFDARRMDKSISEIKLTNNVYQEPSLLSNSTQRTQQARAEAVQWSNLEHGILSVATGNSVQHYDTSSGSRPTLINVNYSADGSVIKAMASYRGKNQNTQENAVESSSSDDDGNDVVDQEQERDRLLNILYPHRMLTVLDDNTIQDMSIDANAPLAISRRDGRLIHSVGPHLWVGSPNEGPSSMEKILISTKEDDISAIMMKRARCLQTSAYSMNPELNIKLLSREIALEDDAEVSTATTVNYSNRELLRLWSWIDRVESLSFEDIEDLDDDNVWTAKSILDSGAWHILGLDSRKSGNDNVETNTEVNISETLDCNVYDSPTRRAALTACGWAGKFDLSIVMAECEALGEFERSAALAVWHENVGAAVVALQRGSQSIRLQLKESNNVSPKTLQYAESLDLIAMCIAGYGGKTIAQMAVWRNACASLLQREDLSVQKASSRVAYLRGLCDFLLNVGTDASVREVLENSHLSLCDRVAFACRFLEEEQLHNFLFNCIEQCQLQGDIEGLVITGVEKIGIKILQSYVDRYADVQTAALVVSRVVLPPDWTLERRVCVEWVDSYRGLLNNWQMWQSRAMFDVDRAEVLRAVKAKVIGAGYQRRMAANPRSRQSPRPPDPDIMPSIPAQLEVRCNYCSSPLSLKRNEGLTNQWLSKMQPLLNCCPQCRKPLPRCSICLLSLGGLNPYMELTRQGSRGIAGKNLPSTDDLSSLSSMSFAEWYTWCMRCRHGGHAHHMLGWFSNQNTCPVSGCDCECEFDGVEKLNRPAMCYEAAN